ncbi:MAG: glutamyl-tRNA reductase [Chloroflexota bacterium]|jgi:glutamyl-tRNA reductase|nr:glutamyl-tRNA reductase [Chloroflexota bacterium]
MTRTPTRHVRAFAAHAREVPAADREQFATDLRAALPIGSILLVTCHRVEAYLPAGRPVPELGGDRLPAGARVLIGEDAARHLLSVAVGRDSVVLGEDEILHQIREAVGSARAAGPLDPAIDRLFALALHAGRRARSWQQGRRRSLGDVAVEAIERIGGPITGRRLLVVGAGKMGSLAARAAARSGAAVTVANRTADRARAVADGVGGDIVALDPGADLASFGGIIVALSGSWQIADTSAAALVRSGVAVVDLSFPAAVPAALGRDLGARLVTADGLAMEDAAEADHRSGVSTVTAGRLDTLIDGSAREFADWQAGGDGRAAADALARRADRERRIELDALWRRVPTLEPEARDAIEGMTRHLAARLLREPLERLGRDPDGPDGSLVRELFAL